MKRSPGFKPCGVQSSTLSFVFHRCCRPSKIDLVANPPVCNTLSDVGRVSFLVPTLCPGF